MTEKMQRIVLAERPQGEPTQANFRLEDGPVPEPKDGEFLARTIYLSLDPYMRGRMDESKSYAKAVDVGGTMEGGVVAQVVTSRNPKFKEGDIVNGQFGWTSHTVHDGTGVRKIDPAIAPISTAVGVLGMPGLTAWHGLNKIGEPKKGETLVVSAATGAVGSLVGQLGKIYGLRVVGVAGGKEKCDYAVKELGLDACVDHRGDDLKDRLKAACPDGIDIYFENVGGATLHAVIPLLNVHARIPICGMISWYNLGGMGLGGAEGRDNLPKIWRTLLVQRAKAQGFIISDHFDELPDFLKEVSAYIRDGKVKYRETVEEGLENAPKAFLSLLKGGNFGKQLVRVSDDPTQ